MKKRSSISNSAFFKLRLTGALTLCLLSATLGLFAFKVSHTVQPTKAVALKTEEPDSEKLMRDMPTLGEDADDEKRDLDRLEQFWNDRLTYPTGRFDPAWVRAAVAQHQAMPLGVPAGSFARLMKPVPAVPTVPVKAGKKGKVAKNAKAKGNAAEVASINPIVPLSLSTTGFTALGPSPEQMTGCTGCYDYVKTQARVNAIAIDPTTTTNGSITAYIGSVGGGVWKTTNCCNTSTTWTVTTDDPLIATTAIDTITIDPNNHNTVYAGTGDLNYGSFSMGSQGILKSTDGGATWTVLGADIFGPSYPQPSGNYPQYASVGKVRVDPNNSSNVAAGTKNGLYLSHDGGTSWTQCATNTFTTQRQDITGLEMTDMGSGVTRIIAAVGTRGFPTYVQYDLGNNGANGIYSATMSSSGCPSFNSIASNANGFVFGTQVTGSPYLTGANMNAGSGVPCNYPISGGNATYCGNGAAGGTTTNGGTVNNLGRIDIAVAASNPNVIYAQVGSIDWNNNSGCGNTSGCQLGVWASADGGNTWSFMTGSAGGSLTACSGGAGGGDYPQNWYDQGIAVDPNNPDRVYIDTFDTWLASRTGTSLYDVTCGYNGSSSANHVVHVDHHALAYAPGSSSLLLEGSDGGIFGSANADTAVVGTTRNTWFNMDTTLNTIEFYSGDISANFATSPSPAAVGGAQDNGPSSVTFSGSPTGPAQWQMGLGGDGFSGQIDSTGGAQSQAQGTITVSGVGTAGQQFMVGTQTFTWAASRTTTGTVAVGTSANSAATAIVTALNADLQGQVTAARSGSSVIVTAVTPGVTGNAIPFSNINSANLTFNGPTLGNTTLGGNPGITGPIFYEGNNSGGLSRCLANCTQPGAVWINSMGGWSGDTQSFVLPINLFHGGIGGGDDCAAGCGHMVAGTTRVWETVTANVGTPGAVAWYVTNNPTSQNLTKQSLGNRSYINQVKYSPKFQSVAIVGTNDANVQIGFNLGTGVQGQANWVDVTGGNTVLPNRPVNGIALDPSVASADVPVGYAAVGGFNANSALPGHVFQVTCTSNCGSFTWLDKTGNLPDFPVECVIVNPVYPQQVFAGTDFGLYFTNDITAATPLWYRYESGLPHAMIWDMSIDRGSTTLALWTRGRGAYAFPLPSADISQTGPVLVSASSRLTHGSAGTFDLNLPLDGSGIEPRDGSGNYTVVLTFDKPPVSGSAQATGTATVSNTSFSGNSMIVSLSGVADQQTITVTGQNVTGTNNASTASAGVTFSVLIGDVDSSRVVDGNDVSAVQGGNRTPVGPTNFTLDCNITGVIDGNDVSLVQSHNRDSLRSR